MKDAYYFLRIGHVAPGLSSEGSSVRCHFIQSGGYLKHGMLTLGLPIFAGADENCELWRVLKGYPRAQTGLPHYVKV